MNNPATVYIGIGTNIGDKPGNIQNALRLMRNVLSDITCAPFYRSKPYYYTDQPDFLNTVCRGETVKSPQALLEELQNIESTLGRVRDKHRPKGPRIIDLDILLYEDVVIQTDTLVIPHPGMIKRPFVLKPLLDLAPGLFEPSKGVPYSEYFSALEDDTEKCCAE